MERLRNVARQTGLQSAVITFSEHPQKVLQGAELPLLTIYQERVELLKKQQVDEIFAFSFDIIKDMTAEEFMLILHRQCGVELLLMGYDHHFGSDRLTHFSDYQALADKIGMQLIELPQLTDSEIGLVPSSTKIRKALLSGTVEEANLMLGYAYTLSGEVVEGRHLGRTIGFPTANIHVPSDKLCPLSGVYAALLTDEELGFNDTPVIVNIGTNPTVGGRQTTVEAHIPDWEGDLYGRHLSVRLTRYLRAEKKFPSMDVLKQQIHKDIENLKSHN